MQTALKQIIEKQNEWALSKGIDNYDKGYTLKLEANLFCPLSQKSISEFLVGKGNELGSPDTVGKMHALHSSAALVVNVFEYWRGKDIRTIAGLCGAIKGNTREMRYEAVHSNALGRIPSHIDVEFSGSSGNIPLAIESKFTETYSRHTYRSLAWSYTHRPGLWKELPSCENLAKRIGAEDRKYTSFEYLDAPQLLKHILGLSTEFGPKGFTLLYLWYGIESPEAKQHWQEITEFESVIKNEIDFRVMTYQDLFARISKERDINQEYLGYLQTRYFSEPYNSLEDRMIAAETKYGVLAGDMKKMEKRRHMHDKMQSKSPEY
jgi:hypothetical protein